MAKTRNRYYNPNPAKREDVGDCVVRALCKVTGQDWDTVFKGLCEIAFTQKAMPSSDTVWKEYAKLHGFEYRKLTIKKGSKRPTPNTFAGKNRQGSYILVVAGHLVGCVDGYYYDFWDCGDKGMYGYWEKTEEDANMQVTWFDYSKDEQITEVITEEHLEWLKKQGHIEVESIEVAGK